MLLNSKQRAYLRGIGNKEETIVRIGKEGLSENVAISLEKALNKREIVKAKVLVNSEEEKNEVAKKLAEMTNSEVVHILGNTILFFKENKQKPVVSQEMKSMK